LRSALEIIRCGSQLAEQDYNDYPEIILAQPDVKINSTITCVWFMFINEQQSILDA